MEYYMIGVELCDIHGPFASKEKALSWLKADSLDLASDAEELTAMPDVEWSDDYLLVQVSGVYRPCPYIRSGGELGLIIGEKELEEIV